MENNKLSQITQKLYEEGLEKGRAEGERIELEARTRAAEIVREAEAKAAATVRKAEADARELQKNTLTEIELAGRQAVARIKGEVAGAVTARSLADGVHKAGLDPAFIKDILLSIARGWNGGAGSRALEALLPEGERARLDAAIAGSAAALLKEGVEVGYSPRVRSGFKVGEKGGGYYIAFEDENFEALLGQYLREKVAEILFGKK